MPLLPSLVLKLGPDWRYIGSRGSFVSKGGSEFQPTGELPGGTRIEPMVPQLAAGDESQFTEDEKNLARYIQVIFPAGTDPGDHLASMSDWPCVEDVRPPPDISLP